MQRFLLLEILSSTLNLNFVISSNFYALHALSASHNFHIIIHIVLMIRNNKSIRLFASMQVIGSNLYRSRHHVRVYLNNILVFSFLHITLQIEIGNTLSTGRKRSRAGYKVPNREGSFFPPSHRVRSVNPKIPLSMSHP